MGAAADLAWEGRLETELRLGDEPRTCVLGRPPLLVKTPGRLLGCQQRIWSLAGAEETEQQQGWRGWTPELMEVLLRVKCGQTASWATETMFVLGRPERRGRARCCLRAAMAAASPPWSRCRPEEPAATDIRADPAPARTLGLSGSSDDGQPILAVQNFFFKIYFKRDGGRGRDRGGSRAHTNLCVGFEGEEESLLEQSHSASPEDTWQPAVQNPPRAEN